MLSASLRMKKWSKYMNSLVRCFCSSLTFVNEIDLAAANDGRHHSDCPLFKTEVYPRLFYYEEAESGWVGAPHIVEYIISADNLDNGESNEVRFKRIDMTDERFYSLPEV